MNDSTTDDTTQPPAEEQAAPAPTPRDISADSAHTKVTFDGLTLDESLSGTLRFHVDLTSTDSEALVAGDTVSIALPADGIAISAFEPTSALETTSTDAAGNPLTGNAVGEWKIQDGRLVLTVGDSAPASFRTDVEIPVTVAQSDLGEAERNVEWTMLAQDTGAATASLTLPAATVDESATEPDPEATPEEQPSTSTPADAGDSSSSATDDSGEKDVEPEPAGPLAFLGNLFNSFVNLLGGPGDQPATSDDGSTTETTVEYTLSEPADESFVIKFADNANPNRPTDDQIAAAASLTFSLEGDETVFSFTWENARDQLHMTQEQFDAIVIESVDNSSTKETYTAADLPTKLTKTTTVTTTTPGAQKTDPETGEPMVDDNGDPVMEDPTVETESTDVETAITWSLIPDFTQWSKDAETPNWDNNYLLVDQDNGVYQANLTLKRDYHFEMVEGEHKATTEELRELLKTTSSHFSINLGAGGTYNLADVMASDDIEWGYADGLLTIYNLPAYTLTGGQPIDVSIVYNGNPDTKPGDDYFRPVYNNAVAPNHGADDTAVFPGGTLRLVRAGSVDFEATKVWLDTDDDADRSPVTYKLFRYREGQSFANAAPVTGKNGYVTVTMTPPDPADGNSVKVDKNTDSDLGGLPKYDPEGYEYYYELRPDTGTDGGYEYVYGTTDEDGAAKNDDALPEKVTSRDGHDAGIYNGGTLTVRRSGTTNVDATKTWRAAAFQNQLSDVTCIFTLQRSSDDGGTWSNVTEGDNDVTCEMKGFSEEWLTKSFSDCGAATEWPEFDALGRPLKYRWVESGVKQGSTPCTFDSTGTNPTFILNLTDPVTGADVEAHFISTVNPDTGNVINAYSATTTLQIQKRWYAGNDDNATYTQHPVAGQNDWPADANFTATFKLYQDGKLIADDLEVNGTTHTIDLSDVLGPDARAVESADDPYNLTLENVPQFTDNGIRHSYLILENSVGENVYTDRAYDADHQTTKFYNRPATEGESSEVNVSKAWLDAGDGHGNAVVTLELVAKHDLAYTKELRDNEGNLIHSAGGIYKSEGDVVATVQVSAKTEWFDTAFIPVGNLTLADFDVRETSIRMNGVDCNVVSGDDAIKAALGARGFTVTDNDLAMFPNHQMVIVNGHVYSVGAPRVNGTLNSLEVTNTRVGWTTLSASKTWIDEGADKDLRPNCSVSLNVTSGAAEVVTDATGAMSIRSYGVDYPVMVSVDGAAPVQCTTELLKMLKGQDSQKWVISYLPKYDKYGSAITYSLSETCADLGDYQSSTAVTTGTADNLHYTYSAGYDFTNQRATTTSVTFTKKWRDDYVYQSGMRPDIFLTLYKRDSSGFSKVDGFIDVKWGLDGDNDGTAGGGSDIVSTVGGTNLQTITINNLPKYDSKGALIAYYASEAMSVDGSTLDYQPVYYEANDTVVSTTNGEVLTGEDAKGNGTAVEDGGTFNNDIAAVQSVKGEKAWADVPTGFLSADFPAVTITVKHNQPSHPGATDVLAAVIHLDPKNFSGSRWSYETGCMTNAQGEYVDVQGNVVTSADQAAKFPMYDEYGVKYTYYVQEYDIEIDPAAPVVGEVDQAAQEAGATPGSIIYKPEYDQTGKSFRIVNTYQGGKAKQSLDVTKVFDGRAADDKFPEKLEFTLYRTYYSKSDKGYVAPQRVDSLTMTAAEFDAAIKGDGSAELTKSFQNLEVYAPNGYLWEYYVVETGTPGYTQSGSVVTTGDGNGSGIADYVPTAVAAGQGKGAVAGVVTLNKGKGEVEFDNEYTPNTLTLTGAKVWSDYEDAYGTRSQFSTDGLVTLKRTNKSGNMTEDVTLQTTDAGATNYIAWNTTGDKGKWTYTISNLEYWSPDSTPWVYTVTEQDIDATTGYKVDTKTQTCTNEKATATGATTYTGSFGDLKNSLDGSVKVTKAWDDGDTHSLRPTQIKVQLQARVAGGTWQDAATFLGASYKTDDDQTLTGNMTYEWKSLPTKYMDGDTLKTVEYRVVETEIGAAGNHEAITPDAVSTEASARASYYNIAADCYTVSGKTTVSGNATTTAITNTRDYVSLSVTKTWTDFDNQWGTRPANDAVTMTIQSSTDGGNTWTTVKKADGSDLTVTINKNNPTATVGNLVRVHDGTPVSYRAIEDMTGMGTYIDGYSIAVDVVPEISDTGDDATTTYTARNDFKGAAADITGASVTIAEEVNNSLKFVNVKGTKQFNAYADGTYYDPTPEGNTPTMHVWRSTDGANWEKAFLADGKTEPTLTWSAATTDGLYNFEIDNLPAADNQGNEYTYQVSEDVAWANNHGFVVTQDGEHGNATTVDRTGDAVVWTANSAITNTPTKFRIDKGFSSNLYTNMDVVSGGTYTVAGTFADGSTSKTIEIAAGASKSSSVLEGQLIPGNEYTVTETAAPDGYKQLGGTATFTVSADGSLTMGTTAPTNGTVASSVKSGVSVLTVTDEPVQVKLNKVIEGSTDKKDVEFTLTPADTTNGYLLDSAGAHQTTATYKTDANGAITMTGLVVGQKYTLTEASSPYPNALLAAYSFTVNADGTVTADAVSANWSVNGAELTATDPYIGLKIQKLDQDGNAVSTDRRVNGNDKTGMGTWTITPADGSTFADGSTAAKTLSYHDGIAYLKHGCTYTVVEATAPWGFAVNGETLTVTASDAGVISIASDKDTSEYAIVTASRKTGDATAATVSLKDKPLTITLHKTNEDGTIDLQGVKWALWGHSLYHPPTGSSITLLGLYSDSNGDSTLGGILLPDVTYGVSEPEPPAGYEWENEKNTISFVLNPDGTVKSYDAGNTSTFVPMTVGGPAVLVQRDKLIEVTLVKKDENGNPIKGSTFTISGRFAAESLNGSLAPADETRTFADTADDSTGSIAIDRLVAGQKYVITETVPPAGYVNASGTADAERFSTTIKVAKDGTVVFDGTPNGQWSLETTGSATSSDHIALKDAKTSLDFVKWGAEADADDNGQKTGIDGATFTVKGVFAGSDQEQEKTFTTGTDTAMEGFIVGNSYTVTETTAPDGYAVCANSFTFTVNQDGTINAAPTDDWKIASGGKGLIVVDSLNGYGLFKASNDNTLAPNAEFEVTGKVRLADGTISAANNKTQVKTTDGIATMPGLLEGETYTIVETKAPDYHVPDATPYTFTIKDGVITSTDANTAWAISDDGKSITMTDVAIRPTLTKTASNNAVVPGAQFTVYRVEAGIETVVGTFTTDSDGKGQLPALLANAEYAVKETITPAGCLTAKDCQLEVSAAGVVSIKGTPEHWSISDDGTKISVEDQLVTATLHKTGDTATAGTKVDLPGAVYEITGKFASTSFVAVEETRTFTTGSDGTVALTGLVTGGTYAVHEKTPPAGYVAGPNFEIKIRLWERCGLRQS